MSTTAIAVTQSFEDRARADTARDNMEGSILAMMEAVNLLLTLVAKPDKWKGTTIRSPSVIDTGNAPVLAASYTPPALPAAPGDYVSLMSQYFAAMAGPTQQQVWSTIDEWLLKYAPRYLAEAASLDSTLADGANNMDPLGEDIQTAMYTKAQNQVDAAAKGAYETSMRTARGAGWEVIQPVQEAVAARLAQSVADSEIMAAATAYIETYKIRVDYKKFCLGTQTQIRMATQTAMMSTLQVLAALKQFALDWAKSAASLGLETYKAQLEEFRWLLEAAVRQFELEMEKIKTQLSTWEVRINSQVNNANLLLGYGKLQIENEQVPYEGDLRAALANLQVHAAGLQTLASSLASAASAQAHYAASAEAVRHTIVASNESL